MATKKIKAIGVETATLIPHKYQIRIRFKADTDITPLLKAIAPGANPDYFSSEYPYFPESKEYYLDTIKHEKGDFVLVIGYNDKKKMQKIIDKCIELVKTK